MMEQFFRGYIFFAVFILLAYLRRCWDLPDLPVYATFTADPLTEVIVLFGFTLAMATICFVWRLRQNDELWREIVPRTEEDCLVEHSQLSWEEDSKE